MTAREDQPETVVIHGEVRARLVVLEMNRLPMTLISLRLPAETVDRPVPSGGDDPTRGAGGRAGLWPFLHRDGKRLLDRIFGDVDVTESADQGGDCTTGLLAEDPGYLVVVDAVGQASSSSWKGRTSTGARQAAVP